MENDLIYSKMSGDSYINQLLSITYEIEKSFDCNFEARCVLLDIFKTYDNAWHDGVMFKLEQNGISDNLRKRLQKFLNNRRKGLEFNGHASSRANVTVGASQVSILAPLLFLMYISNFLRCLSSNIRSVTDVTSLFSVIHDSNTSRTTISFEWSLFFLD